MSDFLFGLTLVSALGCGLAAGVFFAFSSFVMKALDRLPAPQSIAAMQSMNVMAVTPIFMTVFLGTAVSCVLLVVLSWRGAGSIFVVAGAILYLAGAFLLTVVFHVPRNNSLARVDPAAAGAAAIWEKYSTDWTAWNHVRAAASLAAAGSLVIALSKIA